MESCAQSGAKIENGGMDVLIVAAAGNVRDASYSFPALYDSPLVMSIATVDINGERALFSQYND
eukprot:8989373-Ditylum_brightwellii.AAC.1